jgi:hypothetical protein
METLKEKFLCVTYERLVNIQVKWLLAAQHSLRAREDETSRADINDNQEKEFGLRTSIPAPVTDSGQYWHAVKQKYFALSNKLGGFLSNDNDESILARVSRPQEGNRKLFG